MQFTVHNAELEYKFCFSAENLNIIIKSRGTGFYILDIDIPITVWKLVEKQREEFYVRESQRIPWTKNSAKLFKILDNMTGFGEEKAPNFATKPLLEMDWNQFCEHSDDELLIEGNL